MTCSQEETLEKVLMQLGGISAGWNPDSRNNRTNNVDFITIATTGIWAMQ